MLRLGRIIALAGAVALLIAGYFYFPWVTYKNLSGTWHYELTDESFKTLSLAKVPDEVIESLKPLRNQVFKTHEEFVHALPSLSLRYSLAISNAARVGGIPGFGGNTTNDPVCTVDGNGGTCDFAFTAYTFKRRDGAIIKMAGDRDGDYGYQQAFNQVLVDSREYELVEFHSVATHDRRDGVRVARYGTLGAVVIWVLIILCVATIMRAKLLTSVLAIPAVVGGAVPIFIMPDFVAEAATFRDYGIVLDPALGSGCYVSLGGSVLAAIGVVLVWLEPARVLRPWEMVVQLIVGAALIAGSVASFMRAGEAFGASGIYAAEANDIENQLKTNKWDRPRVAGEELVQLGRSAADSLKTRGRLWIGGGVALLLVGVCLIVTPWLRKKKRPPKGSTTGSQ